MTPSLRSTTAAMLVAALCTVTATIFAQGPALAQENDKVATMTLTGTGDVTATPDMAVVTSGVVSQAKTAREALTANTDAMTGLIGEIKSAGIEARDIQTNGFSISPRYAERRDGNGNWQEDRKIVGYQVNNGVSVRVRDLSKLGALLDAMVTKGANNVGGIHFIVSNADERRDEARTAAVTDVKRKAELYAKAAGVKLGRILSISEGDTYRPQPMMMVRSMKAEDASVPMEAGEETLSVNVTITWQLEQ
ncbi:hypothetical protein C8N35_11738 [Breoghania corrubedonensis]|uniref:SIMPL domain-containing protein n=1 Tax=Breoghania corrubedonensis TaxID=665038 RepID=A0A2T5UNZ0_9HYPH|nr:SIMPL domain-containing protein [Breoghania corrubedonensis]PTW53222.1 hypothetical protein C8N35_11738 [Breoghania corrubedonensis]